MIYFIYIILFIIMFMLVVYDKIRYKVLKFFVKLRYTKGDYELLTNISLGIFAGGIIGIFSSSIYTITFWAYSGIAILAFIAMIDNNYKK